MLKCIRPVVASGSIQDIADSGSSLSGEDVISGNLSSSGQSISVRNNVDMGKDLLSSATAYIRLYLLSVLSEDSAIETVAVGNKIEQAVDLVKSHIMLTVREELDLLKEKVRELVERNAQLEYENRFLRAHATVETLASLQHGQTQ